MSRLCDSIEEFIKALITETEGQIDIQRNELADYFRCVPSQINYVLATRFSLDRGYYIESRRGGGGYIRVRRLNIDKDEYLLHLITSRIGVSLTQETADSMIETMADQKIITHREAVIMKTVVNDKSISLPASMKNVIRANLFKSMIMGVLAV